MTAKEYVKCAQEGAENIRHGYIDAKLKAAILGQIAFHDLFYAKILYNWILEKGKDQVPIRYNIALDNFDLVKAKKSHDNSWLFNLEDIYKWIAEEE
jgi:hypothetical protein